MRAAASKPLASPAPCLTASAAAAGYPTIEGVLANGTAASLNATATIGADGSSLVLTAGAPAGFKPTASSYGRASWPLTTFFSQSGLPVIPWYANFTTVDPWTPPAYAAVRDLGVLKRRVAVVSRLGADRVQLVEEA